MKELEVKVVVGADERIYLHWSDEHNNHKYIGYYDPDFVGKDIKIQIYSKTILEINEKQKEEK